MTAMNMYWILKLDAFIFAAGVTAMLLGVALMFVTAGCLTEKISLKRWSYYLAWTAFVFSLIVAVFLPSTKQMAAILVVPSIINNEQVQELPEKVLELGLQWIEELKPKESK